MRDDGAISDARYRAALLTPLAARSERGRREPPLVPHRLDRRAADRPVRRRARAARRARVLHDARRPPPAPGRAGDHEDPRPQAATRPARSSRPTRRPARSARWPSPRRGTSSRSTSLRWGGGRRARRSRRSCSRRRSSAASTRGRRSTCPRRSAARGTGTWRRTSTRTAAGSRSSEATLESDNTVYARLTLDMGPRPDRASSRTDMGVRAKLQPVPPIGLGALPISPLEPRRRVHDARRGRGQAHAAADRARRLPGEPDPPHRAATARAHACSTARSSLR